MREAVSSWGQFCSMVPGVSWKLGPECVSPAFPPSLGVSHYLLLQSFLLKLARLDSVYCNREPLYVGVYVIEQSLVGTVDSADMVFCITF